MKNIAKLMVKCSLGLILTLATAANTHAQTLDASAAIGGVAMGNGLYSYTITLFNASDSTLPIDAFWYAGGGINGNAVGLLPSNPASVSPPAGWAASVVAPSPVSTGYAIDFDASGSQAANGYSYVPINPGFSQVFTFETTDSPAVLSGLTTAPPNIHNDYTPTGTPLQSSQVWSALPYGFMSVSEIILPQGVPEPSSLALIIAGAALSMLKRRRQASGQGASASVLTIGAKFS
jgi:hypothetical protein